MQMLQYFKKQQQVSKKTWIANSEAAYIYCKTNGIQVR